MPWLIDGSNVLGTAGADRHSDEAKRELVRLLSRFARARRTRITCVFDGDAPGGFATGLGTVAVVFSGRRTGDDVILERSAQGRGWTVVTADRALADRVRRRQVSVIGSREFLREAELLPVDEASTAEDWSRWFDDPKNRTDF